MQSACAVCYSTQRTKTAIAAANYAGVEYVIRAMLFVLRLFYPYLCPSCGRHMEAVSMSFDRLYIYQCKHCNGPLFPLYGAR